MNKSAPFPATGRVQTTVPSPLGEIRLVASSKGLAGLWFVRGQRHAPAEETQLSWPSVSTHPLLKEAERQLVAYFSGERREFDLPLDLQQGTAFQQAVWQGLLAIEPGRTESYAALAKRLGKPGAARAVGAAVGRNPVSIVVPCHRIVGATGRLTGYSGGLDRKQALLHLEQEGTLSKTAVEASR